MNEYLMILLQNIWIVANMSILVMSQNKIRKGMNLYQVLSCHLTGIRIQICYSNGEHAQLSLGRISTPKRKKKRIYFSKRFKRRKVTIGLSLWGMDHPQTIYLKPKQETIHLPLTFCFLFSRSTQKQRLNILFIRINFQIHSELHFQTEIHSELPLLDWNNIITRIISSTKSITS